MNLRSIQQNVLPNILFLLIWIGSNVIVFMYTYISYKYDLKYYYLHEILGTSLCISRATANVVCFNLVLVILSVCKILIYSIRDLVSSVLPGTFRRLLDSHVILHVLCAHAICIFSVVHTLAHCVNNYRFRINFSTRFPKLNIAKSKEDINSFTLLLTVPGMTGVLLLILLLLMFISSSAVVRRDRYGIFWYTHHLALPFTIVLLCHSYGSVIKRQSNVDKHIPGCLHNWNSTFNTGQRTSEKELCAEVVEFEDEPAEVWKWLLVPVVIFVIDRTVRIWRSSKTVEVTKTQVHENQIVEMIMEKENLDISPGQYILLKCQNVSRFQWHPFTPTRCPSAASTSGNVSVHINVVGNWTDRLARKIQRTDEESNKLDIFQNQVKVDGPFSSPCKDIRNFRVAICIAAGIGITPFAAVLNGIREQNAETLTGRMYMVWTCREYIGFKCFVNLFYELHKKLEEANKPDYLVSNFFYTGCLEHIEKETCIGPGMGYFKSRLKLGRPQFPILVKDFVRKHRRERIGVFFCGPKKLSSILSKLCNKININGNTLIYHHDSF